MPEFEITHNIESFNAYLADVKKLKNADKGLQTVANSLKNELVANSPVDTGNLRGNWQQPKRVGNIVYRISNNTSYIVYLEYGTSKSQRHAGFCRNTIAKFKAKASEMLSDMIRKEF
jgi:HK97 gp10 family phage protein